MEVYGHVVFTLEIELDCVDCKIEEIVGQEMIEMSFPLQAV